MRVSRIICLYSRDSVFNEIRYLTIFPISSSFWRSKDGQQARIKALAQMDGLGTLGQEQNGNGGPVDNYRSSSSRRRCLGSEAGVCWAALSRSHVAALPASRIRS